MSFEVITMGRLGVDLNPLQSGVPLGSVTSFGRFSRSAASTSPPLRHCTPLTYVVGRALLYPRTTMSQRRST